MTLQMIEQNDITIDDTNDIIKYIYKIFKNDIIKYFVELYIK